MKQKLKETIEKIVLLSQQNEEFSQELKKALNINHSSTPLLGNGNEVKKDVRTIREILEIRANPSISYDFISNQRLRDQLTIDNLRMENAALELKGTDDERKYKFCINMFYQIENLVNYFFSTLYPDIDDLLTCIEENTAEEKNEYYRFHRDSNKKQISDISIYHKLNAICNIFCYNTSIKINFSNLRQIRNDGEHRFVDLSTDKKEGKTYLNKFLIENSFDNIRNLLELLVKDIKLATKDW